MINIGILLNNISWSILKLSSHVIIQYKDLNIWKWTQSQEHWQWDHAKHINTSLFTIEFYNVVTSCYNKIEITNLFNYISSNWKY